MSEFVRAAEWINQMQLDGEPQDKIDADAQHWIDLFIEDEEDRR